MISLGGAGAEGWGRLTSTSCCRKTHARLDERDTAGYPRARDGHAVSKKGDAISRGRWGHPHESYLRSPHAHSGNPEESTNMHFRSAA